MEEDKKSDELPEGHAAKHEQTLDELKEDYQNQMVLRILEVAELQNELELLKIQQDTMSNMIQGNMLNIRALMWTLRGDYYSTEAIELAKATWNAVQLKPRCDKAVASAEETLRLHEEESERLDREFQKRIRAKVEAAAPPINEDK